MSEEGNEEGNDLISEPHTIVLTIIMLPQVHHNVYAV